MCHSAVLRADGHFGGVYHGIPNFDKHIALIPDFSVPIFPIFHLIQIETP
jgi:hypothetical protein